MPEVEQIQLPDAEPATPSDSAGLTPTLGAPESGGSFTGRNGLLRNVLSAVFLGVIIIGLVWFLDRPGGPATSQAIGLTATASGPAPRIGKPAPDFRVVDLDGAPVQLSDFRGHPVWLSFWATWCPPCRAESPDIQAAYQQYGDSGLIVLAIDIGEDRSTVRNYVARAGLTFSIALDPTEDVAAAYRIVGAPTHYFIDADGILRESQIGNLGKKTMEKKLGTILSPPAAADSKGP
jgi:cytochrome c biogenesis protein CcmG, thiol:disulfide interchange protein DsbE